MSPATSYEGRGSLATIIHVSPATSYEGRGSLAQSSTYIQQLVGEGLTCAIIHVYPATSYEGRGSLAQSSTYIQQLVGEGLTCAIIQVSPSTGYEGRSLLGNPQYFSSNLKGLTCGISQLIMSGGVYLHIHPRISRLGYEGRGLLRLSSIPAISRADLSRADLRNHPCISSNWL